MICTNCGANLEQGQLFCGVCGTRVVAAAPVTPDVSVVSDVVAPTEENIALLEQESANVGDMQEVVQFETTPYGTMEAEHEGRIITEAELRKPLSVGAFIAMLLLMMIPVFNVVLILWWAFSRYTNKNKRHFAAAVIILWALAVGLVVAAYFFVPEMKLVVDSLLQETQMLL